MSNSVLECKPVVDRLRQTPINVNNVRGEIIEMTMVYPAEKRYITYLLL
ncbi:MAG: hypothetical protein ACI8RD_005882 [Bacillariaceae sp.]|jgi:hypothetical protein